MSYIPDPRPGAETESDTDISPVLYLPSHTWGAIIILGPFVPIFKRLLQ